MGSILWVVFLLIPEYVIVDSTDRVEVNHVFSNEGRLVFDQIIWWNWSLDNDCYEVVDWRLLKDVRCEKENRRRVWEADHPKGPPYLAEWHSGHACPVKRQGVYVSEWRDEKHNVMRRVWAATSLETWSNYDREIVERDILPEAARKFLTRKRR